MPEQAADVSKQAPDVSEQAAGVDERTASGHRQGPVRSEAARVAVLQATSKLFAERGYERLTMEGVASEAGVSKQTIYRWWPSKGALVSDCLLQGQLFPDRFTVPNSGELRRDLTAWLDTILALLGQPQGELLVRSLIAASVENADIGRRLHESLGASQSLTERFQIAIADGQLAPDARLEEIGEAIIGALLLRALSRSESNAGSIQRLLDALLGPALPA
ncbi:TetR family transcriptional regulator [Pseudoclavibacter sp. AY1F1]|uniref:TetR/AcrR family transcriptional regulator n=1 Tax=Pseudoclavibacter sp. AY1F1 TaxID=2080583 RepID=UPI000CE7D6BC|nr:TetR/AcrR family transcriptional regulator [Pseudoclavibacter sp. AY1F1]PPF42051.1 TetR family transcriptional regulator [Pseudoclavibacter sp. AY1F1]